MSNRKPTSAKQRLSVFSDTPRTGHVLLHSGLFGWLSLLPQFLFLTACVRQRTCTGITRWRMFRLFRGGCCSSRSYSLKAGSPRRIAIQNGMSSSKSAAAVFGFTPSPWPGCGSGSKWRSSFLPIKVSLSTRQVTYVFPSCSFLCQARQSLQLLGLL